MLPTLKNKTFDNIVGEGENDGNHYFLSPSVRLSFLSANAFSLDQSKILSFGKDVMKMAHAIHCGIDL